MSPGQRSAVSLEDSTCGDDQACRPHSADITTIGSANWFDARERFVSPPGVASRDRRKTTVVRRLMDSLGDAARGWFGARSSAVVSLSGAEGQGGGASTGDPDAAGTRHQTGGAAQARARVATSRRAHAHRPTDPRAYRQGATPKSQRRRLGLIRTRGQVLKDGSCQARCQDVPHRDPQTHRASGRGQRLGARPQETAGFAVSLNGRILVFTEGLSRGPPVATPSLIGRPVAQGVRESEAG